MIGFLIGRFQPFHLGHLEAIKFALTKVEHLHVGIGSSNKSHEKRNPFTADERKKMILSSTDDELQKLRKKIIILGEVTVVLSVIILFLASVLNAGGQL